MDMIARRAFERSDVEADGAGRNPREHRSCLARGANWSQDGHDASPSRSGGSVTELPVDTEGAGDAARVEPFGVPPLVNIAHFREVNVLVEVKSN
jgi:hypothetical protein